MDRTIDGITHQLCDVCWKSTKFLGGGRLFRLPDTMNHKGKFFLYSTHSKDLEVEATAASATIDLTQVRAEWVHYVSDLYRIAQRLQYMNVRFGWGFVSKRDPNLSLHEHIQSGKYSLNGSATTTISESDQDDEKSKPPSIWFTNARLMWASVLKAFEDLDVRDDEAEEENIQWETLDQVLQDGDRCSDGSDLTSEGLARRECAVINALAKASEQFVSSDVASIVMGYVGSHYTFTEAKRIPLAKDEKAESIHPVLLAHHEARKAKRTIDDHQERIDSAKRMRLHQILTALTPSQPSNISDAANRDEEDNAND